ncbi:MAG: antibiotic biosynthesis monooxygenase [Verrucomicrobiota bacterium]
MSSPAVFISTAKVRPGSEGDFMQWKERHDALLAKFPGYLSSDIMPPDEHSDVWTMVSNFDSSAALNAWQQSKERAAVVSELLPLVLGGNIGEVMKEDTADAVQPTTNVTQVIISQVKPGMEDGYRAWASRIQQAQARYPGYRGMYLQPPAGNGDHWTTLLRFDTTQHLEAWLAAPERAKLLQESKAFIEKEELMRLATSFPGWVPINPATGKGPPDWKTALLVLLGLYPIVVIELRFLNPLLRGLDSSLATFIGNALSVAGTTFITMPLFVRAFGWWLFVDGNSARRTSPAGLAILVGLFAAEVAFFWRYF